MKRMALGVLAIAALAGASACSDDDGDSGVATQLVYVSGDAQAGNVGAPLAAPFVVEVLTASDEPVEGVELRWVVTGGGALNDATTNTDANGRSSVILTLGPTPGAQSVEVSAPGLDIGEVVFTATASDPGGGGGEGEI